MKTAKEMAQEIAASRSKFVTYGEGDIGIPVDRMEAIEDILNIDDELIGDGTWYECDNEGNITE
jgi:hypothetical protein